MNTGRSLKEFRGHADIVWVAVFSPDGKHIATASQDNTARIWDVGAGSFTELHGHTNGILNAVFSADGQYLITTSWDYTARVWELRTGQSLTVLRGHTETVRSAAFSADNKLIATGSDNTARIFACEVCGTIEELLVLARARPTLMTDV